MSMPTRLRDSPSYRIIKRVATYVPAPSEFFDIRGRLVAKGPTWLLMLMGVGIYSLGVAGLCTALLYTLRHNPETPVISALGSGTCASFAPVSFAHLYASSGTAWSSVRINVVMSDEDSCRRFLQQADPCTGPDARSIEDDSGVRWAYVSWTLSGIPRNFTDANQINVTVGSGSFDAYTTAAPQAITYAVRTSLAADDNGNTTTWERLRDVCRRNYIDVCAAFSKDRYNPPYYCGTQKRSWLEWFNLLDNNTGVLQVIVMFLSVFFSWLLTSMPGSAWWARMVEGVRCLGQSRAHTAQHSGS